MTLTAWPTSVPFDPDDGTAQSYIESLFAAGAPMPLVVLLTGRDARRDGWAARTAIVVATAVANSGGRVILVDASLSEPELHVPLGVENNEGLVDVFLFGASLKSVTQHAPGHSFELIPAGSYTPDSAEVFRSSRWPKLLTDLSNAGATMIAYLPSELAGCTALSRRASAVVVLATQDEEAAVAAGLPPECRVLASLRPAASTMFDLPELQYDSAGEPGEEGLSFRRNAPPPGPVQTVPVTVPEERPQQPPRAVVPDAAPPKEAPRRVEPARNTREDPREALVEALWARRSGAAAAKASAPQVDPVPGKKLTDEEMLAQPVFVRREKVRKRRAWVPLLMCVVLGLFAGIGGFYGYMAYRDAHVQRIAPASTVAAGGAAGAAGAVAPTPAVARPAVVDSVVPFGVAIAADADVASALERVTNLRKAQPDLEFYASPFAIGGKVYYRVLAGPVADTVNALEIVRRLLDARIKTVVSPLNSDIVYGPLAFKLGDFGSRRDAQAREQQLTDKRIPAYIAEVSTPTGGTAYRVYVGAFEGRDADIMRPALRAAGFPDSLIQRTGRTAS
jgi:hypothetical protein